MHQKATTQDVYSLFSDGFKRDIEGNCFAAMLPVTFHSHSSSVFAYIHDFTEVPRFLMEHTVHWNLHPVSNLNFCYQHFLRKQVKRGFKTATTFTSDA